MCNERMLFVVFIYRSSQIRPGGVKEYRESGGRTGIHPKTRELKKKQDSFTSDTFPIMFNWGGKSGSRGGDKSKRQEKNAKGRKQHDESSTASSTETSTTNEYGYEIGTSLSFEQPFRASREIRRRETRICFQQVIPSTSMHWTLVFNMMKNTIR